MPVLHPSGKTAPTGTDRTDRTGGVDEPVPQQDALITTGQAVVAQTPVAAFAPNSLEAAIRRHIADRLAGVEGRPVIRFSPTISPLLNLSRPTYEFAVVDRGREPLGLVPVEVTIYEKGRVQQVVPALLDVSLNRNVVVAAGPINSGQIIERSHLKLEPRTFDRLSHIGSTNPAPFVGQRVSKHLIKAGQIIEAKDIEPVPLVCRNDLVTVWVRRGGLEVKLVAKAMSSAGYGQPVRLMNDMSKESFTAIVVAPKTAELSASHRPEDIEPTVAGTLAPSRHTEGGPADG